MDTINIKIRRVGSFMSRHIPYVVWFKDQKLGNIVRNGDAIFTISREKGVIKIRELGSKIAFHTIQKEIVFFPQYTNRTDNELVCNVVAAVNWLGALTLGIFAPIRKISLELKY